MHWWEHTVEIFCQNFFLSKWSERLQTICVRVSLQLLQLLHLQDFYLSANLNGTKRFQTTATLQATCMFSFSLWTLVPGTRQWLPQIFFHRTVSDETDQAEAAVKMQKPREIVERTTVSVWRLEIFAVASCQEMSRIATAFALGWTLEYSERNTKTPALSRSLQADLGLPGAIVKNIINFLLYF